jgi:hypothetical protein
LIGAFVVLVEIAHSAGREERLHIPQRRVKADGLVTLCGGDDIEIYIPTHHSIGTLDLNFFLTHDCLSQTQTLQALRVRIRNM